MPSALQWAYVGALLPSSYTFFGNLALNNLGVTHINKHAKGLEPLQRVHIWRTFYDLAAKHMATSSLVALIPLGYIAYNTRKSDRRNLSLAAFIADFCVGPFTLYFLMPINHRLIGIDDARDAAAAASVGLDLLARWDYINLFRMALFGVAWACNVSGLFV